MAGESGAHTARGMRKGAALVLGAGLALSLASCDLFGAAGSLFVSDAQEEQLGAEFDKQLHDSAQAYPIYDTTSAQHKAFNRYFQSVAAKIYNSVPAADRPAYSKPFTYTLIDKDVENAFAVPGGYVYVYTGIIKHLRDESELAGILGHESTHILHHHYREQMAKDASLNLALQVVVGNSGQLAQTVAGIFGQMVELKFSRSNEADADENGVKLAGKAGENPLGIAKYFGRVQDQIPQWLSDHPGSSNRVQSVTSEVDSDPSLAQAAADSSSTNHASDFQQALQNL